MYLLWLTPIQHGNMSVPSSIQTEWPLGPLFYELPGSEALDALRGAHTS